MHISNRKAVSSPQPLGDAPRADTSMMLAKTLVKLDTAANVMMGLRACAVENTECFFFCYCLVFLAFGNILLSFLCKEDE